MRLMNLQGCEGEAVKSRYMQDLPITPFAFETMRIVHMRTIRIVLMLYIKEVFYEGTGNMGLVVRSLRPPTHKHL
jgi:hypothetical protein